jgi:aldose 1-epimerase
MTGPTEVVLRSETLEASFLPELGARIHRLRAFGHDLLRTPDDPAAHRADPFFWGAYPMAPWCNRAPAGRAIVAGRRVELQPNFPDGTAIHGLVAAVPWDQRDDGSFELVHRAAGAWAWTFAVRLAPVVRGDELLLDCTLRNLDDAAMPAGLGLHPWFRRPLELRVPAAAVYPSNVESSAEPQAVAGATDLRSLAPPAIGLDGTWTAFDEPGVDLAWPAIGVRARMEVRSSAGGALLAVATPEAVNADAVEPLTHGPDPLRRLAAGEPDAPALLAPGSELLLELRLQFSLVRSDHA